MEESLKYILREQKELSIYSGIGSLLGWDQMTYMPSKGIEDRSEQIALISRLSHQKVISDEFWNHIQNLVKPENYEKLSDNNKIIVKILNEDVEKSRKIPSEFVEKMSKTTTVAYTVWEKARAKSNFPIFAPHLRKIIELEKEYCSYINLPGPLYNSLLDDYEEGMTVDKLKKEFSILKSKLIEILERIKSSDIYKSQKAIDKKFTIDQQKMLCNHIIEQMMLPKDSTRIDQSTHPFTTSMGYDDVRITTNFERENPLFSFFSSVHEAGHALYELGVPQDEFKYTVISDSPSLGMHESQSRFWENMIAKNIHFWKWAYPVFKKAVKDQFKDTDFDVWYRYINQIKPSLIRVEADELTYCLHIILRFEIETDLMNDRINVNDLPEIWNEKMDQFLGIVPENDKEGVLQDMHWSGGSIGYFPTYAIGTIYAAQLYKALTNEHPDTSDEIERGKFLSILEWLRKNVHNYGRMYTADEIIKKACGKGLNSKDLTDYLEDKYYKLYEI